MHRLIKAIAWVSTMTCGLALMLGSPDADGLLLGLTLFALGFALVFD